MRQLRPVHPQLLEDEEEVEVFLSDVDVVEFNGRTPLISLDDLEEVNVLSVTPLFPLNDEEDVDELL